MSRLAAVGERASRCLVHSTSITLSLFLVHNSAVCSTPPASLSVIYRTAVRSFPRSTRLWYFLALCSLDSALPAAVRYYAHVRRVSSTNISLYPASQASSLFSIL